MRIFTAVILLVLLSACAGDGGWVNPALPKDRWSSDLAACRRNADDSLGPTAYVAPGDERSSDPMKMVDRSRDRRRFDALVAMCMEDKGYHPAKEANSK